jgi:hypothetical protein
MKMNIFRSRVCLPAALLLTMFLLALGTGPAQADDECSEQDIIPLGQSIAGKATLCVTGQGVHGRMRAKDLAPGEAYTLWLIYIDDPTVCDPSTLDCFDDADPEGVFGRFDSAVAGKNGKVGFSGSVQGMVPSRENLRS